MKILLVEDNEALRLAIKNIFEESGYVVFDTASGRDAIKIFNENKDILVALLDNMLPDIRGLDVAEHIRRTRPHAIFIMMTAYATVEGILRAMKLGAYEYLQKPFEIESLLMTMRQCKLKLESENLFASLSGKIFISYAREDEINVLPIYERLKDAGYDPWMDIKDIMAGEKWINSIQSAIKISSFFLAFCSNNSVNKRGMIQKEIAMALDVCSGFLEKDIYLVPVRLEDCEVPDRLKAYQWVDFFTSDGWERLIDSIRIGLKRRQEK